MADAKADKNKGNGNTPAAAPRTRKRAERHFMVQRRDGGDWIDGDSQYDGTPQALKAIRDNYGDGSYRVAMITATVRRTTKTTPTVDLTPTDGAAPADDTPKPDPDDTDAQPAV